MRKLLFGLLLTAAMVLSSCDGKESDDTKLTGEKNLSGSITDKKTLDASVEYLLSGPLLVEEGAELHIPAGTVIKAKKGFGSYILVLQGGKIFVNGTSDKPVRMTADIENASAGHWGGLVINGRAPLADPSEKGSTEISSAYLYGGNNPNDNSGSITYLILEYTGARSSADVEHNGLTLNGVGNGTKIENIYVPEGSDDGIEFFGGSVNVKNLLVVNSDDDMFDFTQGYNGTLENCYGIWEPGFKSDESDPRGVEADGNLDGKFSTHPNQSNFTIKNMTIDLRLSADKAEGKYMHDVIKIRRGATANIVNALVKGQGQVKDLIDMTDGKGFGTVNSKISLTNSLKAPISGNEVTNKYDHKDDKGNFKYTETYDYPNVKADAAGNTGCPTDIFAWTGYKF